MKPPRQKHRNKDNAAQYPLQAESNGDAGGPVKARSVSNRFSVKFMTRYRNCLVSTGPAMILIAASIVAVWPGVVAQLGFQPLVDYLMFEGPSKGYIHLSHLKGPDFVDYLFAIHTACLLVGVPAMAFTAFFSLLYMKIPLRHHTKALKQTKFFDHPYIQPGPRFPYTWIKHVLLSGYLLIGMVFYLNAHESLFDDDMLTHGFGIVAYVVFSASMPFFTHIVVYNPYLIMARKIIKSPHTKRGKSRDK